VTKPDAARIAIDIGGTFTDVVLERGRHRITTKVLTTYADPADGVLGGVARVLADAGVSAREVGLVLHGTTLATNALIERRGARTALLTTAGHRDALEMALENRFEQYDIGIDRPEPLVPRALRLPVPERLDAQGNVLVPLDLGAIRALLPTLREQRVESVAIGFLHSWANPAHERAVAAALAAAAPELSLTLSSDVCPEIREFERLSTACANAYVKPLMARYLASLARQLEDHGLRCPLLMMTSGGGLTDLATAAAYPVRLVESGPAGGAILAARLAADCGYPHVLSFDMGGTTAKICLIDGAQPLLSRSFEVGRVYRFKKGSGLPVRIPVIERVEIGAGGGSIARVDRLQRIQVGPDSAASEPGPACYGRGGTRPTVTDADLLLGRIQPAFFAGGTLAIDSDAARRALEAEVGAPLGLSGALAAFGVGAVVDENMAAAARAHAAEWGADVASRTLVAFGGAGPLHAAALADKLKIDRIVVPAGAGVGSAVGFLLAPISFEVVRSRYQRLSTFDAEAIDAVFADMHREALGVVGQAATGAGWRETRRAAMRYVGQGYEIGVPVPSGALGPTASIEMLAAFEREYRRLYGRLIPGLDVEVLSWTLALTALESQAATAASPTVGVAQPGSAALPGKHRSAGHAAADGTATLFDPETGAAGLAPLYRRAALEPGLQVAGPALVVEPQTTAVVPRGFTGWIDPQGHLVIERIREGA
jgi:N-methylhydantoinase A